MAASDSVGELPNTHAIVDGNSTTIRSPKWPYEQWNTTNETEANSHEINKSDNLIKTDSALAKLLNKLSSQTEVLEDETNAAVYKEIKSLMEKTANDLKGKNQIFESCHLIQAGSFAEKTKVGKADEFDYLLVLDFFGDRKVFEPYIIESYFKLFFKDETEEIIDKLKSECSDLIVFEENIICINYCMRRLLLQTFIEVFDATLGPGWKRINTRDDAFCSSPIATTLHLFTETYNMDIDIDVCLCFQLTSEDLTKAAERTHLNKSKYRQENLVFSYLHCLKDVSPFEVFVIIGDGEHFNQLTQTRVTAPLLELSRFRYYGCSDGRVKTYKLAKWLACNFLPKYSVVFGCKRCCHLLIKSYVLKNIILFMMKNYTNDDYWVDDAIRTRVVEVFSILKHCIEGKQTEVANIALCCLPGQLRLDNISTNNPFMKEAVNERSCFLFTEDSHKPFYEISTSPVYQEQLKTENYEADDRVKTWFGRLNQEHWSSYDLIIELEGLLRYLGKLSLN